jgi:hypothetical protein
MLDREKGKPKRKEKEVSLLRVKFYNSAHFNTTLIITGSS